MPLQCAPPGKESRSHRITIVCNQSSQVAHNTIYLEVDCIFLSSGCAKSLHTVSQTHTKQSLLLPNYGAHTCVTIYHPPTHSRYIRRHEESLAEFPHNAIPVPDFIWVGRKKLLGAQHTHYWHWLLPDQIRERVRHKGEERWQRAHSDCQTPFDPDSIQVHMEDKQLRIELLWVPRSSQTSHLPILDAPQTFPLWMQMTAFSPAAYSYDASGI